MNRATPSKKDLVTLGVLFKISVEHLCFFIWVSPTGVVTIPLCENLTTGKRERGMLKVTGKW